MARPLYGRGRIGTCEYEPVDGNRDRWVCRHIKEFRRGCSCGAAKLHTDCGAIHGLVRQLSGVAGNHSAQPAYGQTIELYRRSHANDSDGHDDDDDDKVQFDFVAHQSTGSGGHYAFAALKPGVYDVRILLGACWSIAKHEHGDRVVSIECRPDGHRHSYLLD